MLEATKQLCPTIPPPFAIFQVLTVTICHQRRSLCHRLLKGNTVTLAATSQSGAGKGTGTLAILTFELVAVKPSTLELSAVSLVDSAEQRSFPRTENTRLEFIAISHLVEDINMDGIVNIQDLVLW